MVREILMVGAGSFFGGASSYMVSLLMRFTGNGFPWATFTVNIIGSLLISLLWGVATRYTNVLFAIGSVLFGILAVLLGYLVSK